MVLVVLAAVAASLAGCSRTPTNAVELSVLRTPLEAAPFSDRLRWQADSARFRNDPRGQYELLAAHTSADPDHPIVQTLYVKVLWPIRPGITGTDETTLNARVGYLVRADPGNPQERAFYYEGVGHVLALRPWWGGLRRFHVRRACLKLTRIGGQATAEGDPFAGPIEIRADLAGEVRPGVDEELAAFARTLADLRPPDQPPPATQPE